MSTAILERRIVCRNGSDTAATWTIADHNAAVDEGWFLDHEDGAIQADMEAGTFESHAAAYDHIKAKAGAGDERALRAMIFDAHATLVAWTYELLAITDPV